MTKKKIEIVIIPFLLLSSEPFYVNLNDLIEIMVMMGVDGEAKVVVYPK